MRNRHLVASDAALLPLATWIGAVLRFEGVSWPVGVAHAIVLFVVLATPVKLLLLLGLGMYRRLWRYASLADLEWLAVAAAVCAIAGATVGLGIVPGLFPDAGRVPFSVVALDALLGALVVAGPRLIVRAAGRSRAFRRGRRVVIVGAGAAGGLIVRELSENPHLDLYPIAFLDDDPSKHGRTLHGVPVVGAVSSLPVVAKRLAVQEVIIAMPSAPGMVVREVVRAAGAAGLTPRTVPGLADLIEGRKSVSALRKVEIEDLLRREPIKTDLASVRALAADKTVLVTGAGGSIGSELCRQIARLEPARIIALGRGENSIFELIEELRRTMPHVRVEPVIADVRNRMLLERAFQAFRPHSVFHAAAHKHVPLMEANVAEAVLNNVLGTAVVAELAVKYGAERFVLISSDKAVGPTSIMGATKRLAEGVVQRSAATARGSFVAVRFGNVLGSRGSVVPTFLRQIQSGGPVTITDPEMRRYFMTIPEAVQLVLQAGAMGKGGDVMVLDMGEPVRVVDLARDLIRLSGLEEGRDIEIKFTGMRPGEKLYEELFFGAESATPTGHPKILRARNAALALDGSFSVDALVALAESNAPAVELRRGIKALVPEFTGQIDGAVPGAPPPARIDVPASAPARPAIVRPEPTRPEPTRPQPVSRPVRPAKVAAATPREMDAVPMRAGERAPA